MISKETKESMLKNINLLGSVSESKAAIKPIIADKERNNILNLSSGSPRLHYHIEKKFKLILSQPLALAVLNPFEIRCCFCHEVISYPAWYHRVRYAVNHIHYFICFDKDNNGKPSTKCYRRDV